MKCPICEKESLKCECFQEDYIEVINDQDKEIAKLNKMLASNQLGCEKEIERLKKELKIANESLRIARLDSR